MKINLKHFDFTLRPMSIKKDILDDYHKFKALKVKTEFQSVFLKIVRDQMKKPKYEVVGTHLSTKISKTWKLIDGDTKDILDKESLAKELINIVNLTRSARRELKYSYKEFDGAVYKVLNGVHVKKESILDISSRTAANSPYATKLPRNNSNYIGVELEFNSNVICETQETIAKSLQDAKLSKYVSVGYDGSCGYEVRVLLPEDNFQEILTQIMTILKNKGFTTDTRCGTHVHLDMRNRDYKLVYENLFTTQNFLEKFLIPTRLTNRGFCKKNVCSTFDEQSQSGDRYQAININSYYKYKTLEVRMHHGTLVANELIPWIEFLLKVVNRGDKLNMLVTDVESSKQALNLDDEFVEKIKQRLSLVS